MNGPVPTGARVERDRLMFAIAREEVARHHGIRRRRHAQERSDERCVGLLEVHDRRVRVRRVDRAHVVVAVARLNVVVGIHHEPPRERDVARVERRAVLPLHAAAQMIRDRQAVLRDAAVLERRHHRRELGHELVPIAVVEEVARPEHRDVGVDLKRAEQRVERVRIVDARDAQDAGAGPGVASAALRRSRRSGCTGGAGRDARARGQRDGDGERESGAFHAARFSLRRAPTAPRGARRPGGARP